MIKLSLITTVVLLTCAVVLVFFISLVLYRFYTMLSKVNNEITPVMKRLETTLDEINLELARVDEIIKAGESVAEKVNTTTRLAQEAIQSPLIKIVSFSAGVKKAFDTFSKRKKDV
jgi:predicted PurR-regulated permease PerM